VNLIKTSLWSAVATTIRIAIGFIANKVLAVYIGPGGVAVLGQFNNYVSMVIALGTGGTNTGVTKYIAEYKDNCKKRTDVVRTALLITFYCSIALSFINVVFSKNISQYLFNTMEYENIINVFAALLIFSSITSILISILNGYKKIKQFIIVGILSNVVGLIITFYLVVQFTVCGALLSVVLAQSVSFLITIFFVRNFEWFSLSLLFNKVDWNIVKHLSKYTLMTMTAAIVVPVSQILIRNYLMAALSLEQAGYWQAVWKISDIYLMVVTTSLSTYFLPRLSEINDKQELKQELIRGYKILLPITILMASGIFILRDYIILILFTQSFMAMKDLFLFQLIGDVLKISSWLLSFLMLAKAMTKIFIISEILFSCLFIVLTYVFVNINGLIGVTYAYAANYFLYLIFVWFVMRKQIL
jgi:Uncharacterized membrane protein, putative virulence factor